MARMPIESDQTAQRGQAILSILGTVWTEIHTSRALFQMYGRGLGEFLAQRYFNFLSALASLSRTTVPLHRRTTWKRVEIRQSSILTGDYAMLRHGQEGIVFAPEDLAQTAWTYGGRGNQPTCGVALDTIDATLAHVAVLQDRPLEPTITLSGGTDFWVSDGHLVFRTDPFALEGMPVIEETDAQGTVTDRVLGLWGYESLLDRRDIAERFGMLLDIDGASTPSLRRLINAALDMVCSGPSAYNLHRMLCAMAGVRCSEHEQETVQEILTTATQLVITTDLDAYAFDASAQATVTVGQVIRRGHLLADTVRVLRSADELMEMEGVTVAKMFGRPLDHPITLPNVHVPLVVSGTDGRTKVTAELLGSASVIRRYWNDVHAAGIANGTTLAEAMDIRDEPATQPTASDLPKTINPLALFVEECRGNLVIARLKYAGFTSQACPQHVPALLKKLLPPRLGCLVLVEQTLDQDYIELGSQPEELAAHEGVTFSEDVVGLTDSGPTAWIVGEPCGS